MISDIDQQIENLKELYKEIRDSSDTSDTDKLIKKALVLSEIETAIGCLRHAKRYLTPETKSI